MKRFLHFSTTLLLLFAMVSCYATDGPINPEEPILGNLQLSQDKMSVGAEGGNFSVDIITDYEYAIDINVDWIEVTGGSCSTEYCTLDFYVAKNLAPSKRNGVITVSCNDYNLMATLTVSQEAGSEMPNNEIWYTSSNGKIIEPYATNVFGANIVSNTYENGQGVITFDGDVTQIGDKAFYANDSNIDGGHRLTSITMPHSVTAIGDQAFTYCPLTSIYIPEGVTKIGILAFGACDSLTNLDIANGITHIGERAFISCMSLTSVTIPESVSHIGERAFVNCSSLKAFHGKYASKDSRCLIVDGVLNSFAPAGVTEYSIPEGIEKIGFNAFMNTPQSNDSPLEKVTIPDSVTQMGGSAFYGCNNLTYVYCKPIVPPTVDKIGEIFAKCSSRLIIYVHATSVGAYKTIEGWKEYASNILGYDFERGEESAAIPANNEIWYTSSNGNVVEPYATNVFGANIVSNTYENGQGIITFDGDVTQLGEKAFYNCTSLTRISIPSTVTTSKAFSGCRNLKSVDISDLSAWCKIDFLGSTYGNPLCYGADLYLNGKLVTDLVIPSDISKLKFAAFAGCNSLTSVTLPSNVVSVGKSAFYECVSLANLTIANGVTTLGDSVFANCSSLTEVTLPNSITNIGARAFSRCTSLTAFHGKFASSDGLCLVTNNRLKAFAIGCGATQFSIMEGITSIEASSFSMCTSLRSVTIPDSVIFIEDYAFSYCSLLTGVLIPNSVTLIGAGAFYGCTSLTNITIPKNVVMVDTAAFQNCSMLREVLCRPTTPPEVGNVAFNGNAPGRKIYVPDASVSLYKASQYWSNYTDDICSENDKPAANDSVPVPEDKYPSKTDFKRRILLTQFTGTGCGFCPRIINALYQLNHSSYADDVVLSAAHLYNSGDPAYLSSATGLASSLNITAYPRVCADLNKNAMTNSTYESILSLISDANNRTSVKGGIAVNSVYNAETNTICINTLVKAKESAEFRVSAWLLEDGVYGQQSNNNIAPLEGVDFDIHNNCIRSAYSSLTPYDFTGFPLGTIEAGKTASMEFVFTLKPNGTGSQNNWNHDNLRLIVFISTKEDTGWHVNNVVKVPKNGSVDFEYTE